jgi:hypothetical protein
VAGVVKTGPVKPFFHQAGQVPAVVDVRVGEHHGIDGGAGKGQMPVLRVGILAPALVQTAIEEKSLAAGFEQVHGAGDGAGRAPEGELHQR